MKGKTLSPAAVDVLSAMTVLGHEARIASGQLDRKLYLEVNAALEAIGGKWNRKAQAHVFDGDPADAIDQVAVDGSFCDKRRELDQFFTPPALALRVVNLADVRGRAVLEPSAGHGALVVASIDLGAHFIAASDIDAKCVGLLNSIANRGAARISVAQSDFLKVDASPFFERVVMNPPFSRQQDIDHVLHAFRMLRPGGRLVSVMSAGVKFRSNHKTRAFRELVEKSAGVIAELPDGSFKESGTDVRAILLTMTAAARPS